MTSIPPLATLTLADLYPEQVAFAPRTTVEAIKWVFDDPIRIDAITGSTISVMGNMPLICHRAVATEPALEFIHLAGLKPPSVLLTYGTADEAIALSRQRIKLGERLAYVYPPMDKLDSPQNLLVPTSLYGRLNDKGRMTEYVEHAYLPHRFVVPANDLDQIIRSAPDHPVFIKASLEGASGAGYDVRYSPDNTSWQSAISWFQERRGDLNGVVVEDAIDVKTCWCMGVSILDSGCRYLGSAIQTFDKPAKQNGNRVDPDNMAPEQAVQVALAIADRAHDEGYRGIAGFDIGIDKKGEFFVFDLNFRLNACTCQLLLHDSATQRIGARISESWSAQCDCALTQVLERLRPFVEKGLFVPTRLFDRDTYLEASPGAEAVSLVNGIIFADTIGKIHGIEASMKQSLGDLLQ